jgi:thiol-disulfide isomerase/thioredoxin
MSTSDLAPPSLAATPSELWVACLCAQWCGTCRDYQSLFTQLQAEFEPMKFVWVDIEDHADWVDPIEVENFPTLLMAQGETPLFFGTLTPHVETLRRLIQSQLKDPIAMKGDGALDLQVQALVIRLRQHFGDAL